MTNDKIKLQNALKELDNIVQDLSSKQVDVEVGLAKFKEGVELIKFCRSQLKKAENEFTKLKAELEVDDEVTPSNEKQDEPDDSSIPF